MHPTKKSDIDMYKVNRSELFWCCFVWYIIVITAELTIMLVSDTRMFEMSKMLVLVSLSK